MDEKQAKERQDRLKRWLSEYRSFTSVAGGIGILFMTLVAPISFLYVAAHWGTLAGLPALVLVGYVGYWFFTVPRRYQMPRKLAKFAKRQEQEKR